MKGKRGSEENGQVIHSEQACTEKNLRDGEEKT